MAFPKRFTVGTSAAIGLLACWGLASAQAAPSSKAITLGDATSLTLSAEARLRYDAYTNGQLTSGNHYQQGLLRGILGADLRVNPTLRIFGEIGTGQVEGRRSAATANFQNDAALQQLYVDVHGHIGAARVGAVVGRQEF